MPISTPVAVHPVLVKVTISDGQVIVGLTLSVTTTSWLHVAVLPASSVTVQSTVVVPNGYVVDG